MANTPSAISVHGIMVGMVKVDGENMVGLSVHGGQTCTLSVDEAELLMLQLDSVMATIDEVGDGSAEPESPDDQVH